MDSDTGFWEIYKWCVGDYQGDWLAGKEGERERERQKHRGREVDVEREVCLGRQRSDAGYQVEYG